MICAEFKELVGAFAIGALDPEEQAACEAHLAEAAHDGCEAALAEARATAAVLPVAVAPVAPSPEVWRRIEAEVKQAAPPRRSWAPYALVVLAASIALWLWLDRDREAARAQVAEQAVREARDALKKQGELRRECMAELAALRDRVGTQREAIAMLELPTTRVVAMAATGGGGGGKHSAMVMFNAEKGRAAIIGRDLVAQQGKDYELWVIKGSEAPRAAGLLRVDATGAAAAIIDPAVLAGGVDTFAITLEPAGGGPAPRGPIVLAGKV